MIVIAHHKVKDFNNWKPYYDQDIKRRKDNGIRDIKVGRKADDPNDVYMIWDVEDADKIQELMKSDELRILMEKAGVISPPEISLVLKE